MPLYEFNRGGYIHQYTIVENGIQYFSDPTSLFLEWADFKLVSQGKFQSLVIKTFSGKNLEIWLKPEERNAFLKDMLSSMFKKKPGTALKTASSLVNSKKLMSLWILLTFLFPTLLGGFLLVDAYHTKACDRLLEQGKLAQAQVLKVSKNRRGNYVWKMEFTTDQGQKILEKRVAYVFDEQGNPKDPNVTVVYSDQDTSCWDISLVPNQKVVNVNQRGLWLSLTMSFGWAFLFLSAVFFGYGFLKYFEKNPYHEVASRFLEENLKS